VDSVEVLGRVLRRADPPRELVRFAVLRLLGLVYFVAFLSAYNQYAGLIGEGGLLPAAPWLARVHEAMGRTAYWEVPTLFWLGASDRALGAVSLVGTVLAFSVVLGVSNAFVQVALWALYLSIVHVGQIFWGYGWEEQLLETGFLAVFLCPVTSFRPWPRTRAPAVVIWLFRWLAFRIMLGAGLIKVRGDPCWTELTCLDFHFETQPNPNPLSLLLHAAPHWVHAAGVLLNHGVELVAPWFVFTPWKRARWAAAAAMVFFQGTLIASGNLSFLNWLTIVPALACFDDEALLALLSRASRARKAMAARSSAGDGSIAQRRTSIGLAVLVGFLSIPPVLNLLSEHQAMNRSFEPFGLVNTYGAFGSVDRERYEIILEGTRDPDPETAHWEAYELPCKPGDPMRRPCIVTPYHYRLDWQMWFAAIDMTQGAGIGQEPWLVHLVWQLLSGAPAVKPLLARDPFADAPPRFVRARAYRYEFTRPGEPGCWKRTLRGDYLRPVSREDPELRAYVAAHGWAAGREP
jgi:hypothetical protein